MENLNAQHNGNFTVAKFDPAVTYAGASSLQLSESEMKALCAPFADLEYEITPQGFIYLPQAISLKRLNDVIGIGRWGLLLINTGSQQMKKGHMKVFYDGALLIRNCFVSRAAGEASYSEDNQNQSYATALEAAKTDCRTRCCKDIGIANDAWNPSFTRRWQKEHAVRVFVEKDGKRDVIWRRKDLDPFYNEVGIAPNTPTVPQSQSQPKQPEVKNDLPWLNLPSTAYIQSQIASGTFTNEVLPVKELLEGKTISELRKQYRISKTTTEALEFILKEEWAKRLLTCKTAQVLTESFSTNEKEVKEYKWLYDMFHARRTEIVNGKQAAA